MRFVRERGGRLRKYSEFSRPLAQRLLIDGSVFDGLLSIFHRAVGKSGENIAVVIYTTGVLSIIFDRSLPLKDLTDRARMCTEKSIHKSVPFTRVFRILDLFSDMGLPEIKKRTFN